MNRILLTISLFLSCAAVQSQNLSGQWKGEFIDRSTKFMGWGGDKFEYVLDLETKGKIVTGFSYTYFTESGKRYYTICKVEGTFNSKSKYIEVKEVERTKTNVPREVLNCFQVHKLSFYKKTDGEETLEGKWIPAPNQEGSDCGYGVTALSRRSLAKTFPGIKNNTTASTPKTFSDPRAGSTASTPTKPVQKPVGVVTNPKPPVATIKTKTPFSGSSAAIAIQESPQILTDKTKSNVPDLKPEKTVSPVDGFEKRTNNIIKTIEIESESVVIDLYDNGEIDGDSVSLFFNGKLVLAQKKLTTKPLRLIISQQELEAENELVIYAENLGSIPPNTALMIVTDGTKRYEVRITSDLQKSGTIRFLRKKQ
ncbi:MAG: hypothetical protein WEA59_01005 [Ferruginibacter sp.]